MNRCVEQVLNGDKDAFKQIIRNYVPIVRAMVAASVDSPHTIDDLVQVIFIAIYSNLHRYDAERELSAWIRGIARNKINMHLRSQYRKKRAHDNLRQEVLVQVGQEVDFFQQNRINRVAELKYCLEQLSESSRELIQARHFRREPVADIAQKIGQSVTAVTTALYRIRKKLRVCIDNSAAE